jgi:sugar phosphate isomerase/epimerase
MGFDGIELVNGWPAGSSYPKPNELDRIRALRRQFAAFGLQIFSIQTWAAEAFAPDPAARKAWVDQFREWALLAKQLGCAHLGIWPGGGLRGLTMDQAIDYCGQSFREAGQIAQDLGMIAAFEIEPPFVFNQEEHIVRLLQRADHPGLKTIYDPSHFDLMSKSNGRPHEMLRRIGVKNIGYVHLTDTDGTLRDGGTSKHLAVGDGHAHIDESLRVLRDEGYRGWIMVDGWEIPDPYDAAAKAKKTMDAVAAER